MSYRPDIDGLRTVAVLSVIANHFSAPVLPGGFLGVDIFFVISGFVITLSFIERPTGSAADFFWGFYARRIKRIVPALVLMVLVTALAGSLFIPPQTTEFVNSMKAGAAAVFGFSNIFFYFNALDYFGSAAELNLFTHTWSLGVEEQFYLIYPAILWLVIASRRRALWFISALAILSFGFFAWRLHTNPMEAYFSPFTRFWELAIGCIVAFSMPRRLPAVSALAGAAAIAVAFILPADLSLYSTPLAVGGAAVLISSGGNGDVVSRILSLRPVVFLGLLSYSLYLWHWPVIVISRWTVGIDQWTILPQLALIFVLAVASYFLVEDPLRRKPWSVFRPLTIGYGLASSAAVASVVYLMAFGQIGPLYTGEPVTLIADGVTTLKDKKFYKGQLQWDPADCVLDSKGDTFHAVEWDTCMLAGATNTRRNFLVIGNSFSAASYEMYSYLSDAEYGQVVATSSWGAAPVRQMDNRSPWAKANDHYWSVVIPELVSHLGSGDVLIMINDNHGLASENPNPKSMDALQRGLAEISKEMAAKGASVIYMTQHSLMRDANCSPDMAKVQWFERSQSRCSFYDRDFTRNRIEPLNQTLATVAAEHPNFHILDLSPVFCPGSVCGMFNSDGVPLYRDSFSHPSVEASMISSRLLADLVDNIARTDSPTVATAD